jgi:tetraacyldisaccharide 4'-kinase
VIVDLWESPIVRVALGPAAGVYGGVVAARNALYDRGVLSVHRPAIPTISVGNLTVGGTGKTPIVSHLSQILRERGRQPAIVLRSYRSGDELLVHRALQPQYFAIASLDRLESIAKAAAMGCDVAVLDDGFQHRRVGRAADIVLVSADSWPGPHALLPAGPWREPLSSLRRASLVIVTRKAVDQTAAEAVATIVQEAVPVGVPTAVASLSFDALRAKGGETRPLATLAGQRVHAVTAIGNPRAFFAQLRASGAEIVPHAFRDHHAYTPADVARLVRAANGAAVVCTLKDAVKLMPLWPEEPQTLWYVSQRVTFDRGLDALHGVLDSAIREPA